MNLDKLEKILTVEPKYRANQIKRAVFFDLIENWDVATVLPKSLREKLTKECPLEINAEIFSDKNDLTKKAVFTFDDGVKIETVLMNYLGKKEDNKTPRHTVCVSSQVGCALGCIFCATGQQGWQRNLTAGEIINQVLFFARLLKKENKRVSNVVFMGMGEPFLNYEEVIKAIKILIDQKGLAIGARHISISTIGIPEKIEKFADEGMQVNLALSLHAPNDELRSELVPVNFKYNLKSVLRAIDNYLAKTKRKVMLEYVMLANINDSDFFAKELVQLLRTHIKKERQYLCLINLIAYNQTGNFKSSSREQILKFKRILENAGLQVTERFRFGREIKGACGQLVGGKAK